MPEIWLNYGTTDVVLDIQAENLDQNLDSGGEILDDSMIMEKIGALDITKPTELVVQNYTESVKKVISMIFQKAEQKSLQKPRILADKVILNQVKNLVPDENLISPFEDSELSNPNLVFIGEMEFDGLFGFETISTRLIKKFGQDTMLSAYEKRKNDLPSPGVDTESMQVARTFSDSFEIGAVEIISNSKGIVDLSIGHPSTTQSISKSFTSFARKEIGKHRTMIVSTGKEASNMTLAKSLTSVWNCAEAMKNDGLLILLAECKYGIGSDSIQNYIEKDSEKLLNPSKYVDGMEDLLFLMEIQKKFSIGIISILPEFYTKKLKMESLGGIKKAMDYILKTQGIRQKVQVVSDGARILLR